MAPDVVLVGAGISGLVTAHRLLENQPGLDLQVLEAAPRAGGCLGTEEAAGFLFERGPNSFLDNVTATLDLARELGLGERLLPAAPEAKKRFLVKNGRLVALPHGPLQLFTSPLLSLGGKLRALAEPFQGKRDSAYEESVAAFARRRLGAEAAQRFLDPMVTGIYAGDPERISLEAAFPRLAAFEREHGGIVKGVIAKARAARKARAEAKARGEPPPPRSGGVGRTCSFHSGLEELTRALASRLGPRLRLAQGVDTLRVRKGEGFEIALRDRSVVRARSVVLAIPSPRAATLVSSWNSDLAIALEEIPYAPVAVICLAYRRDQVSHPLDGFGFLAGRDQGLRILGAIFVSTLFPAHAPSGTVSLRVLAGGARDPEAVALSEGELEALAVRELTSLVGIQGEPVERRVFRWAQGIPQYNVGHSKRVRRIEGWLAQLPGLFVTGNAYRGVGINDCVSEGRRVAEEVSAFLGKPAR